MVKKSPTAPQSPDDPITLPLTRGECQNIVIALGKFPYEQVHELVEKIKSKIK
jgi:hypothetical protein